MPCLRSVIWLAMDSTDTYTADLLLDDMLGNRHILLIDCRNQNDFSKSHISGAINVSLPNLMMKRLERGTLNVACIFQNNEALRKFTSCSASHTLVLYDQNSHILDPQSTAVLNLLARKLAHDGYEVKFLTGGYNGFFTRHPEHCVIQRDVNGEIFGLRNLSIDDDRSSSNPAAVVNNSNLEMPPVSSPFPVKVLPFLYLGNAKNSTDLALLKNCGIRYILNVTPNMPNVFENDESFKYLQIPITDHCDQNVSAFFGEAFSFIEEGRTNGHSVLVHCLAGVSRSVTVTVAYLMRSMRLSMNDAYDLVKRCKPNISPNFNFMGQLLEFEETLRRRGSSSDVDEIPPFADRANPSRSCPSSWPEMSPKPDCDYGPGDLVSQFTDIFYPDAANRLTTTRPGFASDSSESSEWDTSSNQNTPLSSNQLTPLSPPVQRAASLSPSIRFLPPSQHAPLSPNQNTFLSPSNEHAHLSSNQDASLSPSDQYSSLSSYQDTSFSLSNRHSPLSSNQNTSLSPSTLHSPSSS